MKNATSFGFPCLGRCLAAGIVVFVAACQAPPPPAPDGSWSIPSAAVARLTLSLDGLPGEPRRARFTGADGRYVEETAQWGGGDRNQPSAGLRLSEASPGPPRSDPRDPESILTQWTVLKDMRPAFTELHTAGNAYGPVSWWRVALGTSTCMLFVQRLPARGSAAATLSGFYCNPQGAPLSSQAVMTIIERIGLRATPKTP